MALLCGVLAGMMEPLLMVSAGLVAQIIFGEPGHTNMLDKYLTNYPGIKQHLDGFLTLLPHANGSKVLSGFAVLAILTIPLVMLVRNLTTYLNIYLLQWVSVRAITDLRIRVFNHLLNMPLSFLSKISTGEIMSRINGDTGQLQVGISNALVTLIKDPVTVVSLVIGLILINPVWTLIAVVVVPLCAIPIIAYSRKVRSSSRLIQDQYAQTSKIMHEAFTGNRIIKAYNLEKTVEDDFHNASDKYIGHFMRIVRSSELPGPLIEVFASVGVAGIFYYILFISHEKIEIDKFLVFVGFVFSLYKPIKSLTRLNSQMEQADAASRRVFELLETTTNLPEPANPKPLVAKDADILFDGIDFQYDTKPILHNFNLSIKAGQMVAFVGQSGSGKTTLTNLLLRFYDPQKGGIKIGGIDVRDVTTKDLRGQIAVVTQETLLFDETIRRNIELGRPGASEADIVAAAKSAHAHDFILEKDEGYRTLIGERGVLVSGGQKQRLAIARAILKNAPILILDEATSSLDSESERTVQSALEVLMQGRTTICIAHRLSTIQKADMIVVMEQGRILETGKHDELLARNGAYRRLYELQFHDQKTV